MGDAQIGNIGACVFDAYGTLIDFNAAVRKCADRLGDKTEAVGDMWRRKQLEYTWLRSLMGRHADFWQVTGEALDFSLDWAVIKDKELRDRLMEIYREPSLYPEVAETLKVLKSSGMATAILSNGSPEMLNAAVESTGLGDLLDDIYSVETVGIFKPHPSVYQIAVDGLDITSERVCFLSANAWDIAGAASFGFRSAWINRAGQPQERLPDGPVAELDTLAGLPRLLGV